MNEVEVLGLKITHRREGSGRPLVLAHGFVGDGRSTWSRQIERLSEDFMVVAWDAPGAGRSSDPPGSSRLPEYAGCLAAFVWALELEKQHLVGLSFGGALALEVFRRHPDVPRTLVLASACAGRAGSLEADETRDRLATCLRLSDLPPAEFAAAMIPSMFSAAAPRQAVTDFEPSVRGFSPVGFRVMARASAEADLRDVLPAVDVPTLLLFGDQDVGAPPRVGEALHAAIPGSRLVVLRGAGHVSAVEAQICLPEVLEFLAGTAGSTSG
jgi:pimeloyl-ACP methyl ester carboxylesterase